VCGPHFGSRVSLHQGDGGTLRFEYLVRASGGHQMSRMCDQDTAMSSVLCPWQPGQEQNLVAHQAPSETGFPDSCQTFPCHSFPRTPASNPVTGPYFPHSGKYRVEKWLSTILMSLPSG